MSDISRFPGSDREPDPVEEARVRQLIEGAGRADELPSDDLRAIRAAAREAWRSAYPAKRAERPGPAAAKADAGFWTAVGIAAAVILALGLATWWLGRAGGDAPVTAGLAADLPTDVLVERVLGAVTVDPDGNGPTGPRPLQVAERLAAGAVIETPVSTPAASDPSAREAGAPAASGVGLRLAEGLTVRVDQRSRIRWLGAGVIGLEAGAVYVDALAGAEGGDLSVRTALGTARHVGTQFEVRWLEGEVDATRVRVREGSILFHTSDGVPDATVAAGDEWTLGEDGSVVTGKVAPWNSEWDWVQSSAPRFDPRGHTVAEYLAWLARETGWAIRFSPPELEAQVGGAAAGGNFGDMRPDETADAMLESARLSGRLIEGVLVISRAE